MMGLLPHGDVEVVTCMLFSGSWAESVRASNDGGSFSHLVENPAGTLIVTTTGCLGFAQRIFPDLSHHPALGVRILIPP